MADVAFLQALRGAMAGQLGQTQADAGGGTVHTWEPVPRTPGGPSLAMPAPQMSPPAGVGDPNVRSWEPVPQSPPQQPAGGGFNDAMSAGDALFHRLGPAFDPIMSGMRTAFGLGPTANQTPAPPILSQSQAMNPADAPWYTPPDPNTRSFGQPPASGGGRFGNLPQPRPWQ